jgi:GNAT superfamily N-acetyltransferase
MIRERVEVVRAIESAERVEVEVSHELHYSTWPGRMPAGSSGRGLLGTLAVDLAELIEDFAPGDRRFGTLDWSDLQVRRIRDAADTDFDAAYERLWAEFGALGEMERRAVICDRLEWDPAQPLAGAALAYELLVLRRGGAVAALRDHTAVVRVGADGRPLAVPIVVHLSHALVEPAHRGTGLVAWLRALPLQTARRCAQAAGCAPNTPVVLVAEMEMRDVVEPGRPEAPGPAGHEARMARLRSYERAGFRMVDPVAAPYAQPDFRPPEALVGAAPRSVPLGLVVRRVGRESETTMPASELRAVIDAIYAVYGVHVPGAALEPLRAAAAVWTGRPAPFRLLPPTS